MSKRCFIGIVSLCIIIGSLAGCAGKKNSKTTSDTAASTTSYEAGFQSNVSYEMNEEAMEMKETPTEPAISDDNGESIANTDTPSEVAGEYEQKLIRTVYMSVETEHFDETVNQIDELLKQVGGYTGSSNLYNTSSNRQYSIEMRIPKDKLDTFLDHISDIGMMKIRNKSENSEDITLNYYDSVEHKKSLEIERDRILELIEQADTLEYVIDLENKLSELRYQISSYESQLRRMDSQVSYSTVTMDINEVKAITVEKDDSISQRIQSGFKNNITNVGNGIVNIFVWFVTTLPYLVLWAAGISIAVVIGRRIYKKTTKKEEKDK